MDATQTQGKDDFTLSCAVHRYELRAPFASIALRLSPAEREDAMKTRGNTPCNEYWHTSMTSRDRIEFRFVTTDRNTPSACTVRLGDIDPLSGKPITEVALLQEYHKLADHQIYVNRKETRNRVSLEGLINDDGDSKLERKQQYSVPCADPFGEEEPDEILKLREVAARLTGRQADIYEALLVNCSGGREKISMTSIAKKWGVSTTQICKDRDRIIRMIREKVGPERNNLIRPAK